MLALKEKTNHQSIFMLICLSILLILLGKWLFYRAGYDLNFMDEGYYLNWFKNAPNYHFSATSFGFIYRTIFVLLNENIVAFRYFNIAANLVLGLTLTYFFLLSANFNKLNANLYALLICASVSALLILIRQDVFLATPSYNTLTFQGAMIFCAGLFLLDQPKQNQHTQTFSAVLISIGGWLVFLGKPTSAVLLAPMFIFFLWLNHRALFSRVLCLTAVITVFLVLITSFIIDDGIVRFYTRYMQGLQVMKAYDAGYSTSLSDMFRLDIATLKISNHDLTHIAIASSLVSLIIYLSLQKHSSGFHFFVNFLAFIILASAFAILVGYMEPMFFYHEFYMLIFFGILIGVGAITFLHREHINQGTIRKIFPLILMPYILAFGTGNSYWHLSLSASFFWVLAATALLIQHKKFKESAAAINFYSATIFFFSVASLWISGYFPQAKMDAFNSDVYRPFLIHQKHQIQLTAPLAEYFERLVQESKRMGFQEGTPVIDMTGQYGLSVFILNGYPIGMPMLYGGQKGSNTVAKMALGSVSCEVIAKSWLIYEPRGYRKLSDQILEEFGLDLAKDYELSKMFRGLADKGNRFMSPSRQLVRKPNKQYLLKPKSDHKKIIDTCEKLRRG